LLQFGDELFEPFVVGQVALEFGKLAGGHVAGPVTSLLPCLELVVGAESHRSFASGLRAEAVKLAEFAPLHAPDRGKFFEEVADSRR